MEIKIMPLRSPGYFSLSEKNIEIGDKIYILEHILKNEWRVVEQTRHFDITQLVIYNDEEPSLKEIEGRLLCSDCGAQTFQIRDVFEYLDAVYKNPAEQKAYADAGLERKLIYLAKKINEYLEGGETNDV
jgi:hypothetical protein